MLQIKRLGKQLQNLNISINFLTKNATIVTNLSSLISEKIKSEYFDDRLLVSSFLNRMQNLLG